MKSVCVMVVTYNRKEYLKQLIENGILNQTYPIEKLLIFDNYSSDGTDQMLMNLGVIDKNEVGVINESTYKGIKILYYRNNTNEGGSGGFNGGLKISGELGCDLIWTMDDDVLPDPDCLAKLIQKIDGKHRVCIPSRTDERYTDYAIINVNMNNPFLYNVESKKKKIRNEQIDGDSVVVQDMPFEGPLFDTSIVREIGLPKKELFIFYDDSEYAYRASLVTDILYVKDAILHKQIIPKKDNSRMMGWRAYYAYRNQYWFNKTYEKNLFVKKLRPLFNHMDLCLRAIIKRKWGNIRVLNKAYHDGTKGLLGKTVSPGDTI